MPNLPGLPENLLLNPKFLEALKNESAERFAELLLGIQRYQAHPYQRTLSDPPVIWSKGNARLLDFAPQNKGPVVLLIPSLINRYYILDLSEEKSLVRFLASQGLRPMLMDWGELGDDESDFSIDDYITGYLSDAVQIVKQKSHQPIIAAGYCMGGVFALALSQLLPSIAGLVLLATPWDFHSPDITQIPLGEHEVSNISNWIMGMENIPPAYVQAMFYLSNPWLFHQKFRALGSMAKGSRQMEEFVELESWVNDGVALSTKVAREVLIDWVHRNTLLTKQWHAGGRIIDPANVRIPTLIAAPKDDRIVPNSCSMPLANEIPGAMVLQPSSGHVSMIVGNKARQELWQPLIVWLKAYFS